MSLFEFKKKILVVEDEPDIAESLKARLELEGFKILLASEGKTGVEKARSEKPDLIILDVMMPILDGFEACRILKADPKTQEIPVLILTALPHLRDTERAFEVGADAFLNKPYTNERLIQKVKSLVEKNLK